MKSGRLWAFTAVASALVAAGSFTTVGADAPLTDLGDFTVGQTVPFPFTCPNPGNSFFLFVGNPSTKVDEQLIPASADLLFGYQYATGALEPGEYSAGIECNDAGGIFDFTFTLLAADPCAAPDTTDVPKGPGRAPHSVPLLCENQGAGIPTTGSSSSPYILMLGTVAIVAGGSMLVARRRIRA